MHEIAKTVLRYSLPMKMYTMWFQTILGKENKEKKEKKWHTVSCSSMYTFGYMKWHMNRSEYDSQNCQCLKMREVLMSEVDSNETLLFRRQKKIK